MPPLGDGLWCGMKRSLPYGSGTGFCLLSSFFLFRTRYIRYLMAIWCMFFYEALV